MLLEIDDLYAGYGAIEALHGVSCNVAEGETVALIGANGAGKSTLLNGVAGLRPPHGPCILRGDIKLHGKSLLKLPAHQLVRQHKVALVPEGRHIFGNLTVLQNLKIATTIRNDRRAIEDDYQQMYTMFPRLQERLKQRAELLSGGEQQMLAVARALMTGCRILLLDEPSMGLAPIMVQELFRKLHELKSRGMTILLVEQNANVALRLADRVYILESGRIVHSGTPQELQKDRRIQQAYLGVH